MMIMQKTPMQLDGLKQLLTLQADLELAIVAGVKTLGNANDHIN